MANKITLTKKELLDIAKTVHSGSDIAKQLGYSVTGIHLHIKRLGINKKELIFLQKPKFSSISREQLMEALEECNWHQSEAAKLLNSSPSTINRLIDKYNIVRVVRAYIELDINFNIFGVPIVNKLGLSDIYLQDMIEKLEGKIDVIDENTWLCKYSTTNGYPKITLCKNGKPSSHKIHRIIYQLTKVVLTSDICLCHNDDNKLNVHPDNLFEGSRIDNNNDKAEKFRTNSDLSEEDILHIVELYDIHKWTQKEIGEKFQISQVQVGRILRRECFKHVERKIFPGVVIKSRTMVGSSHKNSKVSDEQVLEIRRLWSEGVSKGELSRRYSLDRKTVSDMVERRTWKHI
jgi:DNA-binding MarR family transcriptional regulator